GSSGHPANPRIERYQMLDGRGPENHSLGFRGHTLLGFHSSMESRWPASVQSDPALEFIHHLYSAALDQVIHIAAKKRVGFERVLHGGVQAEIAFLEEVAAAERIFYRADAGVGKGSVVAACVDCVVRPRPQAAHDLIDC